MNNGQVYIKNKKKTTKCISSSWYLLRQFSQRGFWIMATGKQPRQSFLDYRPFLHSTVGYLFEIQIRLFKNPKWHNFPLVCYVFTCEIYLSSSCLKKGGGDRYVHSSKRGHKLIIIFYTYPAAWNNDRSRFRGRIKEKYFILLVNN